MSLQPRVEEHLLNLDVIVQRRGVGVIAHPRGHAIGILGDPLFDERPNEFSSAVAVLRIGAETNNGAEQPGHAVAQLGAARAPVAAAGRLGVITISRRRWPWLEILLTGE